MKPKTISIIGGTGSLGSKFARAFKSKGYRVLVSSRRTILTNIRAAEQGDVVIVCVPIRTTEKIIKEISPHLKKGAMLSDFTSVKVKPSQWMLKYTSQRKDIELIPCHPLFNPSVDFKGQNFAMCPVRGNRYTSWYKSFIKSLGLNVITISPDEHDKTMAVVQCLNHLSNLSFGYTLKKANFKPEKAKEFSTSAYRLRLYPIGRLFYQDAEMYADIETENPYSRKIAKIHLKALKEIYKTIARKDKKRFEEIFNETKSFFGDLTEKSQGISNEMIKCLVEIENKYNKKGKKKNAKRR